MAATILSGSELAAEIRAEVATGVIEMQEKHGVTPGLAVVLVGDDPASAVYVANKQRACREAGLFSDSAHLTGYGYRGRNPRRRQRLQRRFAGFTASWCSCPCPLALTSTASLRPSDPGQGR